MKIIWKKVTQSFSDLTSTVKAKKALPFIQAYSASDNGELPCLLALCTEGTTVCNIPALCEKQKHEDNFEQLVKEIMSLFCWLRFDENELINRILINIFNKIGKDERSVEILTLRAQGLSLDEIGNQFAITRERVRQIESNALRRYRGAYCYKNMYNGQRYDLIMLIYALKDGNNVIYFNDLKSFADNYSPVLWYCIKSTSANETYYYLKENDAIIFALNDEKSNAGEFSRQLSDCLSSLPEIIESSQKNTLLISLSLQYDIPVEILRNRFDSEYQQSGVFYHNSRLTVSYVCDYVLKNCFQTGFKIDDNYEANRFRQYLSKFFGDKFANMKNRALDAKIGSVGILCDRGKYIHPDYLQVDMSVIDAVNNYIEDSPRAVLHYKEIFEDLRDIFDGTQITNRYILHGALKKYGCRYRTDRDTVRKTESVSFLDEFEAFIEKSGILYKAEIFDEFKSLNEGTLAQVVARSENVFSIDNGCYIHACEFDIQPQDYDSIREYLTCACRVLPVNIRAVQQEFFEKFPDFMYRNDFSDKGKLFAALNYMFRNEFDFSRAYIAKLGTDNLTNRGVILRHLVDCDSVEAQCLTDICDENNIRYISPLYLYQSLSPDFLRVDEETLMRPNFAGITDSVVAKTEEIISQMITAHDYVVGSKINDYLQFPQLEVEWNEFLLDSIISLNNNIRIIRIFGNSRSRSNALYVSEKYETDNFNSFLVKILTDEVHKGSFASKKDMLEWMVEQGFAVKKLPAFLQSAKYFYVNETGLHCADE